MAKAIDSSIALTATIAAALKADGIAFAIRYIDNNPSSWKRITKAEAELISAAGLQIVSVFEKMGDRDNITADKGKRDGEWALQAAKEVGQPDGSCIYFAVDYEAQPSDMDNIAAYIKAAAVATPTYSTGVYGSKAVIDEMQKRGVCSHFWQTYAWSQNSKNSSLHLYQYQNGVHLHGIEVDLDETYGNEGGWSLNTEIKPVLSINDANKVIGLLSEAYRLGVTSIPLPDGTIAKVDQAEIHRLANVQRTASGQPII